MNNVNTYRVIDFIMPFLPEPVGDSMVLAQRHLTELVSAYDALAPTPKQWAAHPWAQWVTIFDNGKLVWWELEPTARIMPRGEYAWIEKDGLMGMAREEQVSPLPLGIDWRLCKWSRPEVTK